MLFLYLWQENPLLITQLEAQALKQQEQLLEHSRLTTILSIGFITILILLGLSLFKNFKLQKEIKSLKTD